MKDRDVRFHEKWLGLAQPIEGLVFSVPVLADAQIAPEVRPGLTQELEGQLTKVDDRYRSRAFTFRGPTCFHPASKFAAAIARPIASTPSHFRWQTRVLVRRRSRPPARRSTSHALRT
jgi:hypothetical protein